MLLPLRPLGFLGVTASEGGVWPGDIAGMETWTRREFEPPCATDGPFYRVPRRGWNKVRSLKAKTVTLPGGGRHGLNMR